MWDDCGLLSIERAGLSGYLDFRSARSAVALPGLLSQGETLDLVYVDGSHLFEDVFVDAYFVTRMLSQNGVVAFDDSPDPHVQKVLRFLRSNCGDGLEELDLSPYRGDGGTSLRYRLARLLGKVQLTAFRRVGRVERAWNAAFHSF